MSRWGCGHQGTQIRPGTHILLGSVPPEDFPDHDIHMDICWKKVTDDVCSQPLRGHHTTYTECCCQDGEAWSQQCALCPPRSSGKRAPVDVGIALRRWYYHPEKRRVIREPWPCPPSWSFRTKKDTGMVRNPHVFSSWATSHRSQLSELQLAGAKLRPSPSPNRGLCSAVQCGSD